MKTYDPDQSLFDFGGTLEEEKYEPITIQTVPGYDIAKVMEEASQVTASASGTLAGGALGASITGGIGYGLGDLSSLQKSLTDLKHYNQQPYSPMQRLRELKKQIEEHEKQILLLKQEEEQIAEAARKEAEELLSYLEKRKIKDSPEEQATGRVIED